MPTLDNWVTLVAAFASAGLGFGVLASSLLARGSQQRQRLVKLAAEPVGVIGTPVQLAEVPNPVLARLSKALPKSPKDLSRLRRQLAHAGIHSLSAAVVFSAAKMFLPIILGGAVLFALGDRGVLWAMAFAVIGYLLPVVYLMRKTRLRRRAIDNALPDALDLMIVCLEAGCGLNQAIEKAGDELAISHPALAQELKIITTEIRAGKSRTEALKNFASRTDVDDVRTLVAMLTQTDRFGTSVGQALRTHADTARTKRRQRAEEKAAKLGVKMVFPLAFCLFPALYVVCFGPVVVKIYRAFF